MRGSRTGMRTGLPSKEYLHRTSVVDITSQEDVSGSCLLARESGVQRVSIRAITRRLVDSACCHSNGAMIRGSEAGDTSTTQERLRGAA